MTRISTLLTAATAMILATAAIPAHATVTVQTVSVSTAGLDLSTAEGRATLARRADRAARAVCAHDSAEWDVRAARSERRCRADVKANVLAQIETRGVIVASR